jgi:glutathione S-transferase
MKLYVAPGACSMSCHIAFEESGLSFEPILSPWGDRARWEEIEKLNPQGSVPVLLLDEASKSSHGQVLTQNIAILTYIAEKAPESGLLPPPGTFERAKTYQWLSWVAADLHKAFGPLFGDSITPEERHEAVEQITALLEEVERHLEGKNYLMGDQFTIADAYLFTVYSWTRVVKIPTQNYPRLNAYSQRAGQRPAVRAVLKREGLLK